jgi:hypothetical protein
MDSNITLNQEAQRVQASGVLGEAKMRRLFDYLAGCSQTAESPKEIAIAIDVFGKKADFDVSQDALVRVYIHKLRRTLEEFYATQGGANITPLHIPRGEYRLTLRPNVPASPAAASATAALSASAAPPPTPVPAASIPQPRRQHRGIAVLIGAATAGAVLLMVFGILRLRAPQSDLDLVRANPVWSAILKDDRPILVVMGDYYLIGETDESMEVKRLIREYSVNSRSDLDSFVRVHPEVADRYMDVGLRYLPTSAAFALRDIMPLLGTGRRRVNVIMTSDVTPASLKFADIVYIGYFSGLGIMQQTVFAGSRFNIGQSYDELLDTRTKHLYISQTASQTMGTPQSSGKESSYRDYGFFSNFRGPGGNIIMVISGTRDEGVRQTSEALTNPEKLKELTRQVDAAQPFEALLEVSALDGVNLSGKVLLESKR